MGGRVVLPVAEGRVLFSAGGGAAYMRYTESLQQPSEYFEFQCDVCTARSGWGYYGLASGSVALDRMHLFRIGATARYYGGHTDGDPFGPIAGVRTRDRWINITGDFGSIDGGEGSFRLLDAWGNYEFDNGLNLKWGQFKVPVLREFLVDERYQLAVDRSVTHSAFATGYTQGVSLSYRDADGELRRTPERAVLEDMDALPFVVDVYKRDLVVEQYFIGYLLHPYVSLYTGRGCRSKCTFCLWPQTVGGQRYRTRSVEHVVAEIAHAQKLFPRV